MKAELLYPELSYQIIGCAFEVFNVLGGGHKEIAYHKACGIEFAKKSIAFNENLYSPLIYQDSVVEKNFFDFSVENKIVVELKSRDRFIKRDFEQLSNYLNNSNLKLGILIAFGRTDVKFKRVLNIELLNREKNNLDTNYKSVTNITDEKQS